MRKYSFVWVTGVFFLISFIGHWTLPGSRSSRSR